LYDHEQQLFHLEDIKSVDLVHHHLTHIETLDKGGKSGIDDSDQLGGQIGAGSLLQCGLDMQQLGDVILLVFLHELAGEGEHLGGDRL